MDGFVPEAVTKTLTGFGIKPGARSDGALVTYISLRMENRGGAPVTGTPELYFTDPDGLAIQLQDTKYLRRRRVPRRHLPRVAEPRQRG